MLCIKHWFEVGSMNLKQVILLPMLYQQFDCCSLHYYLGVSIIIPHTLKSTGHNSGFQGCMLCTMYCWNSPYGSGEYLLKLL